MKHKTNKQKNKLKALAVSLEGKSGVVDTEGFQM